MKLTHWRRPFEVRKEGSDIPWFTVRDGNGHVIYETLNETRARELCVMLNRGAESYENEVDAVAAEG